MEIGDTILIEATWYDLLDEDDENVQLAIVNSKSGHIIVCPEFHPPLPEFNIKSEKTLRRKDSHNFGRHTVQEKTVSDNGTQVKLVVKAEDELVTVKRVCMLRDQW